MAQWKTVSLRPTSLDAPIGDDDSADFGEIIGDEKAKSPFETMNDRQIRLEMEDMIGRLDAREQDILIRRYGLRGQSVETLEDVGTKHNITRERVRQIQNAAILKLRDLMTADEPDRVEAEGKEA